NRRTPLHYAAERGEEKRVKALLEAGAAVSARGSNQQDTPLHLAALHGHENCVRLLLNAGADV
ncbi:ankyrin repeat-containing domain protein, partial [Baffinella frigidus]